MERAIQASGAAAMADRINPEDVSASSDTVASELARPKGSPRRMLNRQRILLTLLDVADREALKTEVMKWAFVLSEETPSRGGSAFFQFVPHKFGPFSFGLYHEMGNLIRDGYVTDVNERWKLTTAGRSAVRAADARVREDARSTVARLRGKRRDELVEYVYSRYPRYTINSELGPRMSRVRTAPRVFTAGYEGLQVDGFMNHLIWSGIERVIDVRANPVSRRYGFHRSTMHSISGRLGLEYTHFPELGIASEARQGLGSTVTHRELFDDYERDVLQKQRDAVGAVADLVRERPSVLVCMEARHCECHRSRLARAVAALSKLAIVNLEPAS